MMISRVAESCFWMCRYMERVESTARILAVNRAFVMTAHLPPWARWRPMVIVVGEEEAFTERHGAEAMSQGEVVQAHLTWDESCPVSIRSSLRWARENARTSREVLTLEMWRSLNTFWLWLGSDEARALYDGQRHSFYSEVIDRCHQFLGVCYGTMLRHEPYDFMRLGFYLERAGQTARLLDVHQHQLAPAGRAAMTRVEENIFWGAVLKSCSAFEMYLKRFQRALCPEDVYRFLVLEPGFPRAVRFCIGRAQELLEDLHPDAAVGSGATALCQALATDLDDLDRRESPLERDPHEALTWIVDTTAQLCGAIADDYFNLTTPPLPAAGDGGAAPAQQS